MPNKHYMNMMAPSSPSTKSGGRQAIPASKDSGFPGVPGKTQPKDRSNGITKTGKLGPFNIKSEGI